MTGKEIVKNIALKFDLEENAVEDFVGAVTGKMLEAFRKGKGVNIPGFGKFFVIPKTEAGIKIKTVSFSPSRKFADSVNEDFSDLVPEIISAGSLKVKNEIRVAEVPYEIEGTDFTYFVFDEDEIQEEVREQDEIQEEKISETVQAETPLTADIQYTGQDITEEFDLQVEEEQSIQGIPETAEPEVRKDAETQEDVIPDAQTVFAEPRYFKYSGVPKSPETELIADESEQDFFIDEAPVAEEQQSLTGPESFIADKEQDFEYPFDSGEASINKEDDIILIKPGTQEKERGESYGITGFTLDKPFFKSAVFGSLHPEELKDDIVADGIESEILNLLKEREELILSLNLLEGITATKDDVLTAETGTHIEEETAEELKTEPEITEPEITEEFLLGEKETIPAEEITVTGEEIPIPEEETAVTEEEITVREEEIKVPEEEIEQPEAGIAKPDEEITVPVEETAGEKSPEEETIQEIPSETDYADETVSKTEVPEVLPEEIQLISETPVESIPAEELDEEVRRRIEELEELAKLRDELQKEAVLETGNVEMQVFEKLIDESETETETETGTAEIQEIIIHDPEGFEPASLTEALQEVDLESPSRHFESFDNIKDENVKSYDDVFDAAEEQAVPQFSTEEDKKLTPRSYLKFFLYLFFIFLLATFSFYVYKKILMVPGSSGVVDTAGTVISDSLKSVLTEVDSAEMQEQEISVLEDIEVESSGDIIYRKMNEEYRIQISVFGKLADAEQFITNLKEKDFEAKIERADLPMGKTEYRIVVGPFSTLDEAKSYYNSKSMILNFIKVLTPANTGLHLM